MGSEGKGRAGMEAAGAGDRNGTGQGSGQNS